MSDIVPKGVTALVHWPDGDVLASSSDFGSSGAAGFTAWERQRMRAREAVIRAAIGRICHPDVAACLESYHAEQLMQELIRVKGYSISIITHGDDDAQIEREKRR